MEGWMWRVGVGFRRESEKNAGGKVRGSCGHGAQQCCAPTRETQEGGASPAPTKERLEWIIGRSRDGRLRDRFRGRSRGEVRWAACYWDAVAVVWRCCCWWVAWCLGAS